ncbi:MAG: FAD-dependent oxidoreductase [Firmicutes bacterium]|nr:FAD-dependent oxidoreductase [Bacillota bacterium]
MAKIVILGSGFAGLTAAVRLRRRLRGTSHQVVVVDKSPTFVYRPALVEVAFGHKPPSDVTFDLAATYRRLGIGFVQAAIESLRPDIKIVQTREGTITYDKLIVALGEQHAYEEIPGLREHAYNVCSLPEALRLNEALRAWQGGPVVVGWAQFVQTGGPAFEVALELRRWMVQRGLHDPIHFVDPLSTIWAPAGHEAGAFMQQLFDQQAIIRHGGVHIHAVTPDSVQLSNGEVIASSLTIVTPPFRGVNAQAALAHGHPRDWLETGRDMKSVHHPDIYVAGSATAFDGPKQAHTAMRQAEVAADNLLLDLTHSPARRRQYEHEMSCVLDFGRGRGLYVRRSLWSDDHQEMRIGRQWPIAKSLLAYLYVKTPVFKQWGASMPN